MSKTVSTCLLETNQVPNKQQENVFFHSLYRTEPEFSEEFLRTAKSTSPIQIVALFSTQGPDTPAASLNIQLNKELSAIVAKAQKQPVLDFDAFSSKVVEVLNICVCNFIVSHGGIPLRTSMTMLILDGDILRVIHIGNTKAVLFRDNRIMALTEEQTVAHRYVQMNAITPQQEKTHPERETLTQYLGKMPQDGAVTPDTKVNLKLKDNDELFLFGIGIAKYIPQQMRNIIIAKPMPTEEKAREIIVSAYNYGVKFGLSVLSMKIESTFLLPGDAVLNTAAAATVNPIATDLNSALAEKSCFDDFEPFEDAMEIRENVADTQTFDRSEMSYDSYDDEEETLDLAGRKKKRKAILFEVLIYVLVFVLFAGGTFGILYFISRQKNLITNETELPVADQTQALVVKYINADGTPLYFENNADSVQIYVLNAGDTVNVLSDDGVMSNVECNGYSGYVYNQFLSDVPVAATPETTETTETVETTPLETEESEAGGGLVVATTAGTGTTTSATTSAVSTTAAAQQTPETTPVQETTETTVETTAETTAAETTEATTASSAENVETTASTTEPEATSEPAAPATP